MSMKRRLMKAARSQKQKKEVERMSEEEARKVLANIALTMNPMTNEEKQAAEILKETQE